MDRPAGAFSSLAPSGKNDKAPRPGRAALDASALSPRAALRRVLARLAAAGLRATVAPEQEGWPLRRLLRQELRISGSFLSRLKWRPGAILLNGQPATVAALGQGVLCGTFIAAHGNRLRARKQWLRHAPASGVVQVDAGAASALLRGASLLPGGVGGVQGDFRRGDLIEIRDAQERLLARGLAQYNAAESTRIAGRHSRDIESILGYRYDEVMVHRDDLVLLAGSEQSRETAA